MYNLMIAETRSNLHQVYNNVMLLDMKIRKNYLKYYVFTTEFDCFYLQITYYIITKSVCI